MKQVSYFGCFLLLLIFFSACKIRQKAKSLPVVSADSAPKIQATKHNDSLFSVQSNYLLKNANNQWELYVEGDDYERGTIEGALLDSLMKFQENAFVSKIKSFAPSEKGQHRMLGFISWFSRKIENYVEEEHKLELYGLSKYMSDTFNFIGPPYLRNMYYHAAHDIGHALMDMSKVACTSTAVWGQRTKDGELLLARNLDFYLSDSFSLNKVIYFVRPTKGIPYVSIAWPGMIGVLSGMNMSGLSITLNAGRSSMPFKAKEPISLLAKFILTHASTLEEAIDIAKNAHVFVSESLLIGSAKDNKAIVIEISPKKIDVYQLDDSTQLVCSNHFQSKAYANDKRNNERKRMGHSMYRYKRMQELLAQDSLFSVNDMVNLLRNKEGLNNKKIGYGNEKAINQLLCHHGVVFQPKEKRIWISSAPYNLGKFSAFDLDEVFSTNAPTYQSHCIDSLVIQRDSFLLSKEYVNYEQYRKMDALVDNFIRFGCDSVAADFLETYRQLNPELWSVYYKSGYIDYQQKNYLQAHKMFQLALQKEVTTVYDVDKVKKMLHKTDKKIR